MVDISLKYIIDFQNLQRLENDCSVIKREEKCLPGKYYYLKRESSLEFVLNSVWYISWT